VEFDSDMVVAADLCVLARYQPRVLLFANYHHEYQYQTSLTRREDTRFSYTCDAQVSI
jgi:hypothetical protein